MIIVTGGAGFIGSNFIINLLAKNKEHILVIDKLTYAGNLDNLKSANENPYFSFVNGSINDKDLLNDLINVHKPRAIINFAAESHVDRSISDPFEFIYTNIVGTFTLLDCSKNYWNTLGLDRDSFRFFHISTDEVYGSLGVDDPPFSESSPYLPNSPYSASKASSDHLVRSYSHTYGLPTLTSNCSNNYGPFQFPEKLIPLCIAKALCGEEIPIYGDGKQVRDWLYVHDHCRAIELILENGLPGSTYNIGGSSEKTNIEVVEGICGLLDRLNPSIRGTSYLSQIAYVKDRPGHDRRYAIDSSKITRELGWEPHETFETGLEKTINWYLSNEEWVGRCLSGKYKNIL